MTVEPCSFPLLSLVAIPWLLLSPSLLFFLFHHRSGLSCRRDTTTTTTTFITRSPSPAFNPILRFVASDAITPWPLTLSHFGDVYSYQRKGRLRRRRRRRHRSFPPPPPKRLFSRKRFAGDFLYVSLRYYALCVCVIVIRVFWDWATAILFYRSTNYVFCFVWLYIYTKYSSLMVVVGWMWCGNDEIF